MRALVAAVDNTVHDGEGERYYLAVVRDAHSRTYAERGKILLYNAVAEAVYGADNRSRQLFLLPRERTIRGICLACAGNDLGYLFSQLGCSRLSEGHYQHA